MHYTFFAFLLIVIVFNFAIPSALAQSMEMKKAMKGGALDVLLDLKPPQLPNNESQFKVTFLQHGTDKVQPHIDYDFIIMNGGKKVFSASEQTNQNQPLHTTEGIVTIPYNFQRLNNYSGNLLYTVDILVTGIYFIPINPDSVEFQLKVTPNVSVGKLGCCGI